MFLMRLWQRVVLFVVTVALTWPIAAELWPRMGLRALATGLVALQPKLAFGGGHRQPRPDARGVRHRRAAGGPAAGAHGPELGHCRRLAVCSVRAGCSRIRAGYFLPPFAVIALAIGALRFRDRLRWTRARPPPRWQPSSSPSWRPCSGSRGHTAGAGGSGRETRRSTVNPRQFLSYRLAVLPAQAELHEPEGRAARSTATARSTSRVSSAASPRSASTTARSSPTCCSSLAGVGLVALYTTIVARWRTVLASWPVVVAVRDLLRRPDGPAAPRQLPRCAAQHRRRHHGALPAARGRAVRRGSGLGVLVAAAARRARARRVLLGLARCWPSAAWA